MQVRRRFLITGASGFIGRHAVAELLNQGHDIVALSRSASVSDSRVSVLPCNLLAGIDLHSAIQAARADTLLHLAWETQHGYYWEAPENLDWLAASTLLIKAFSETGGKRVIVAGTCAEYDPPADAVCDALSTPCAPTHLYSASKDSLRRSIEAYARNVDLSFAWARVFHLAGPGESKGRLVPAAIRAFSEGRSFDIKSAGKRLDVMDVRDCGRAFAALAASEFEGPINIGSGRLFPIGEIVNELAELLGRPKLSVTWPGTGPSEGLSDRCADLTGLRKVLGFNPIYSLRDTLLAAIASNSALITGQDKK
jgi:nucleoside-diphosphate-sugar epimerase